MLFTFNKLTHLDTRNKYRKMKWRKA